LIYCCCSKKILLFFTFIIDEIPFFKIYFSLLFSFLF
jgi:hypothetical protein